MAHSTRSPRRTVTEQLDALVADHARIKAELDQALAGNRNAEVYSQKLAELARALDVAQDDFATVMPIARIRQIVGFRHNCRYGAGDHQ